MELGKHLVKFLSVAYRLAIAFWVGGAALFTFVLTPALFGSYNRDQAGAIVGVLFPGYFLWGLLCGAIALACLPVAKSHRRQTSTILLVAMLIATSIQAFYIEPRAAALKKEIPSFVTTPVDDPLRQEFRKLHAVSAAANLGVIGGGVALLVLL